MKTAVFALLFAITPGCGGSTVGAPPPAPAPPPQENVPPIAKASPPPPPTSESKPAPVGPSPMDVVANELGAIGWKCASRAAELPSLQCMGGEANPQASFLVTYSNLDSGCTRDDACSIRLVSYDAPRVFGTPCEKFEDAMNDLTNVQHRFVVTCNDTTNDPLTSQQFGFTTTIPVTDVNKPGVAAVVPVHRADRLLAIKKLVSIKAILGAQATGPRARHDVVR